MHSALFPGDLNNEFAEVSSPSVTVNGLVKPIFQVELYQLKGSILKDLNSKHAESPSSITAELPSIQRPRSKENYHIDSVLSP